MPRPAASPPRAVATTAFATVRAEGGLLPPDLLARIAANDPDLPGLDPADYGLAGERLNEAAARAWANARAYWPAFRAATNSLGAGERGTTETRDQWLLPLFRELGHGRLVFRPAAEEIGGRRYAISHQAGEGRGPEAPPVHTLSCQDPIDKPARLTADAADPSRLRVSPHGLIQEYLNAGDHLWGVVSNGLRLRLLRDNASLSRAAFVEFDLEAMMVGGAYADFVLLFLLLHRSRLPGPGTPPEACWLERWRLEAEQQGTRALNGLRDGVEAAIRALGQGLLEHPANGALREQLVGGGLTVEGYYRQLLRLVYRLLFLLAAEDRDLLFEEGADPRLKEVYRRHYGLGRLRELVERRRHADRHDDLWRSLALAFAALRDEAGGEPLGLKPLAGGLFGPGSCDELDGLRLANHRLLDAVRGLTWFTDPGDGQRLARRVNYRDMDVEELGSVYESLLDSQPVLSTAGSAPTFDLGASGERKSTGSYYTNPGLVRELIASALEPVIDDALARGRTREERTANLLALNVCDPACGSGHFLLAAARRIGREVARLEAGETEPDPAAVRRGVREAIAHCVFGVDLNPLAVDLCKLALWLEGHDPGRPLGFLDHHVKRGNALVGATRAAMDAGIPDDAFAPVTGDDKAIAKAVHARNRLERRGNVGIDLDVPLPDSPEGESLHRYFAELKRDDDSLRAVEEKAAVYERHQRNPAYLRKRLTADLWTAAFFWPLRPGEPPAPTHGVWRRLANDPLLVDYVTPGKAEALRDRAGSRTVQIGDELARQHAFFHWELEFEDVFSGEWPGFDLVLGNPPWDTLSPDAKEFFAVYDPQVRVQSASGQAQIVARLREDPSIDARWQAHCRTLYAEVRFFKQSGRYRLYAPGNLGKGDFNIYRMFTETALAVVRNGGRVAQLLPEGLYNGANAMAIRRHLFESTALDRLVGFENARKYWFPDNHSALKFCCYSARMGGRTDSVDVAFNVKTLEQLAEVDAGAVMQMPVSMIREFSPDALAIMELGSQYEIDIASKMYARWPKFGDEEAGPPHRRYMREIDMGNDRDLFMEDPTGVPVYEGRMVAQYDHRAKGYRSGRGRSAVWEDLSFADPAKEIQPQWYIPHGLVPDRVRDRMGRFRLGFCDVGSPTNERSLMAALIPPGVVCGHSLPTVEFDPGFEWSYMLWLGVANSFTMDFLVRMKASLHMTYTLLDSLPFPRLQINDSLLPPIATLVLGLTCTSSEMVPFWNTMSEHGWVSPCRPGDPIPGLFDQEGRIAARAELEALVAIGLFGLTRDEMAHVLDTFPIVARRDRALFGEERTKRLCLEAYDYHAPDARVALRTEVERIELRLRALVVATCGPGVAAVPPKVLEKLSDQWTRSRNGGAGAPDALPLAVLLEASYLMNLKEILIAPANWPRVEARFGHPSKAEFESRFWRLNALRNALAHPKEHVIPGEVREDGERAVAWFKDVLDG